MSHTLTFSQLVGSFTVDKELLGAQDPYVIFEAGGNKCQTKAIKSVGAGTAEWKETYTLNEFTSKNSTVLEVNVYNHNTLRPDGTIGSGTVDLARLGQSQLSGSGDRVSVHLTDKKGKSVGELKFIINGGGYSGSSSSAGYGTSTGSGIAHGTRGGNYQESDNNSSGRGAVTGVGAGSTEHIAHQAAHKAARQGEDVNIRTNEGVASGRPTGAGYDHDSSRGVHDSSRGVHTKGVDVAAGEVIDRKYYTGVEDRPQEQALVETFREHNPYAKEYETTVQHTGRERLVGSSIEALGTQERVVDSHHHIHGQPHDHISHALPEGAISERPGGEGWVQGKAGPICDSTKFEVTGDRTVDKERVTNLREHREFEKEFEVKTALVGEHTLDHAAQTEQLNRERILLDEKNKIACEGHPSVDVATGGTPAAGYGGTDSHTGHGHTSKHGHTSGHGTGAIWGEGVRDPTSGHSTHGTSGMREATNAGQGNTAAAGQEKGIFQKVKESVTGQSGSTY